MVEPLSVYFSKLLSLIYTFSFQSLNRCNFTSMFKSLTELCIYKPIMNVLSKQWTVLWLGNHSIITLGDSQYKQKMEKDEYICVYQFKICI